MVNIIIKVQYINFFIIFNCTCKNKIDTNMDTSITIIIGSVIGIGCYQPLIIGWLENQLMWLSVQPYWTSTTWTRSFSSIVQQL